MLVRQKGLQTFLAFATNESIVAALAHRGGINLQFLARFQIAKNRRAVEGKLDFAGIADLENDDIVPMAAEEPESVAIILDALIHAEIPADGSKPITDLPRLGYVVVPHVFAARRAGPRLRRVARMRWAVGTGSPLARATSVVVHSGVC